MFLKNKIEMDCMAKLLEFDRAPMGETKGKSNLLIAVGQRLGKWKADQNEQ